MRPNLPPPVGAPGTLAPGEALTSSPGALSDIMAMATGRGTVKLMDMREPDKLRVVELTPDQWRAILAKLDQAIAVAEGRHSAQSHGAPR